MEKERMHTLIRQVPTISRRVNLAALTTNKGSKLRSAFFLFCIVPAVFVADQNGGLLTLGFNGTTMEREYKMRVDYFSGRVFAGERSTLPTFKRLI